MMARTRCWDCMFCDEVADSCAVSDLFRCDDDNCEATDEQLASAAAQIAALQRERELERLPEQQRKDYGDKRAPWHIGFDSVYPHGETWTLCEHDWYGDTETAPDLPEGGRLCAKCARELERRTRGAVVRK